jgi:hypothetical protein
VTRGRAERSGDGRLAGLVAVCALTVVTVGLRWLTTFGVSWRDGRIAHRDSDSFYHLRRLAALAEQGGPLVVDPHATWPEPFVCAWPVALEYLALALSRLSGLSLEAAAAVFPVLVGAASVAAMFFVLRPRFGAWPAAVGAAWVAVVPVAVVPTAFGIFDHHGLELLICIVAMGVFERRDALRRPALWGAALLGAPLLLADGAYLPLGAAGVATVWAGLREMIGRGAPSGAGGVRPLLCGAVVGGVVVTGIELWAELPRAFPATGRIWLLGLLAGAVPLLGGTRAWRIGGGLLMLVSAWLAFGVFFTGAGLVVGVDDIGGSIGEVQPLHAHVGYSLASFYAAAVVGAAWATLRPQTRRQWPGVTVLVVGGGLLGLVVGKYAFLLVLTGAWCLAALARRVTGTQIARGFAAVVVAGGLAGVALQLQAAPELRPDDIAFDSMAALLADAEALEPGAVVVRPGLGPKVLHWTGRPVTAVPFWSTKESAAQYRATVELLLEADEEVAAAAMDRMGARYVLVEYLWNRLPSLYAAVGKAPPDEAGGAEASAELTGALWYRMFRFDGRAYPPAGVPALRHFRWVASRVQGEAGYKLFERVPAPAAGR